MAKRGSWTTSQLEKKILWPMFSIYIRLRDSDKKGYCKCITCGKVAFWHGGTMQAGHFITSDKRAVKYDERNVNAQCYGCNVPRKGEQFLHGMAIDRIYGEGTKEELNAQRHVLHKMYRPEVIEKINHYYHKATEEAKKRKLTFTPPPGLKTILQHE